MAVNIYDVHDMERRAASSAAYIADSEFHAIEAEANARGYRKASIAEIHASAQRASFAPDLFCWRGGLWVSMAETV